LGMLPRTLLLFGARVVRLTGSDVSSGGSPLSSVRLGHSVGVGLEEPVAWFEHGAIARIGAGVRSRSLRDGLEDGLGN